MFLHKISLTFKEYYESVGKLTEKSDIPAAIFYPRADYNGAFDADSLAIAVMERQHEKTYKAFVGSVEEMCDELVLAKEKFGKLPGVLVLRGHGNPVSLQLGSSEYLVSGKTHFPEGCLEDNLAKNATIILHSCSAGKSFWHGFPSVAEWIAGQVPGRKVIAVTVPAYSDLHRYNFNFKTNDPEATYNDGEDRTVTYSFPTKVTSKPSLFTYLMKDIDPVVKGIVSQIW